MRAAPLRSPLVYRERAAPQTGCGASAVALHGRGGDCRQLDTLCRALGRDVFVSAPQAARPCSPLSGARAWGPYRGFAWFVEGEGAAPEPASFGDSLRLLLRFVADARARRPGGRVLLVGHGQGGLLALAAAARLRERPAAVAAIAARLPREPGGSGTGRATLVPGWALPSGDGLGGLPVLLVDDPDAGGRGATRGERGLDRRGARVERAAAPGCARDPARAAPQLGRFAAALGGWAAGAS